MTKYILKNMGYPSGKTFGRKKEIQELKKQIIEETAFLTEAMQGKERFEMRLFCIVNDIYSIPKCPSCGVSVKIKQNSSHGSNLYDSYVFTSYCSQSCSRTSPDVMKKRMETMTEKYGDHNMKTDEGKKEFSESFIGRYGVDSPMKVESIKNKVSTTHKEKYGTHYFASEEWKNKRSEVFMDKFGVDHPMKLTSIKERIRKTNNERYGRNNHTQSHIPESILDILQDRDAVEVLYEEHKFYSVISKKLGVSAANIQRVFSSFNFEPFYHKRSSRKEQEIADYVSSLGFETVRNSRTALTGQELDLYVEEAKVAIEFNGLYWHSELFKKKDAHQKKSLECFEKGIQLIHVWEDDWDNNRELVKLKIASKLGKAPKSFFARKTQLVELTSKEAHDFLEINHIQGKTTATIWLGLKDEKSELVACLGMKKNQLSWDLVRYSTNQNVVGGFSKLLSYFKKNFKWNEIRTFAHLDYSHGNVYELSGFEKQHITVPGMWYYKLGDRRYRRERFMKHKLKDMFTNFDENKTEHEIMKLNGYVRIYDAGSILYIMKKENPSM